MIVKHFVVILLSDDEQEVEYSEGSDEHAQDERDSAQADNSESEAGEANDPGGTTASPCKDFDSKCHKAYNARRMRKSLSLVGSSPAHIKPNSLSTFTLNV